MHLYSDKARCFNQSGRALYRNVIINIYINAVYCVVQGHPQNNNHSNNSNKATGRYFPVMLFIVLYKIVTTFDFVVEILEYDH